MMQKAVEIQKKLIIDSSKERICMRCKGRRKMYKLGDAYSHSSFGGTHVSCPLCLGEGKIKKIAPKIDGLKTIDLLGGKIIEIKYDFDKEKGLSFSDAVESLDAFNSDQTNENKEEIIITEIESVSERKKGRPRKSKA